MSALQLSRPLAFIDLETTGTNVATDRIIEIAIVKVMPDRSVVKK
ncbi:exonuclease domain-containing protein [Chitinophaga sedimenti]|nr:exonuclease domain-containing protein [Chitinophaga sedimenti]